MSADHIKAIRLVVIGFGITVLILSVEQSQAGVTANLLQRAAQLIRHPSFISSTLGAGKQTISPLSAIWLSRPISSFPVHDVPIARDRLEHFPKDERFTHYSDKYSLEPGSISEAEQLEQNLIQPDTVTTACDFASIMIKAFRDHRPVVITPDSVWMMILQGFSNHINTNPEKYRSLFVNHEGRKQLSIVAQPDDADLTSQLFCQAIDGNITDKELVASLSTPFSTSTEDDLVAFRFAVMGVVQNYFSYYMTLSGIPHITFKGSLKDWTNLRTRLAHLRNYDLDWWVDALDPVLEKFSQTADQPTAQVDRKFWQGMIKYFPPDAGSGSVSGINGWIINFYPYISNPRGGDEMVRNDDNFVIGNLSVGLPDKKVVAPVLLPASYTKVPITFQKPDLTDEEHMVISGILGAHQTENTLALTPAVGWVRGKIAK